jgi:hypothetical protein
MIFLSIFVVSFRLCREIGSLRRELIRLSKDKVLFIDETYLRLSSVRHRTLVAPGEQKYIAVDDTSSYAARYDMIACCSGNRVFPPKIITPQDRAAVGTAGVTKQMVLDYIQDILAQAAGALDLYPLVLVTDKSTSHNAGEMLQMFHDNGCQDMQTIYSMPTNSAKRLSPLDNSLFAHWKYLCRQRGRIKESNIVQVMSDCWNNITQSTIHNNYRHCGIMHGRGVYFDCPDPHTHAHNN